MKISFTASTIFMISLMGLQNLSFAQFSFPLLSPKGQLNQNVGNTDLEIVYERPCVRGRKIFGELVPWNQVWRTGAGYCTKISFSKPMVFGGQTIPSGKYSFLTIPNPEEWVIILNRDTTLYGASNYDSAKDVVRIRSKPQKCPRFYESLTFEIDIVPDNANLYLSWANTQLKIELKTTTDVEVWSYIEDSLLTVKEKDSYQYAYAAEYLMFQDTALDQAMILSEYALELDQKNGWARRLKIELLESFKSYDEALKAVELMIEFSTDQSTIEFWEVYADRIRAKMK